MSVVPTPTAWAVTACSKMFIGKFAELDAKAEAQRVGGECIAYALYTAPVVADAVLEMAIEQIVAVQEGWGDVAEECGMSTAIATIRKLQEQLK